MPDDGISLKTAENARYLHNKGKDPSAKQNLADEVLSVFNMCYDQTFIKEVIFSNPSNPPSVICYSDEQMLSLKSSLSNGGILGIDRTFNLGACYVTTLTFKNKNIIRTTSGEPAIMLGPVYFHWEGSFQSYHRFLSHIQSRFSDIDTSKIVSGSDGEKAVINAISECFPNSTHTLCTRHLKENLAHQLRKEMTMENATSIVNKIFNRETGLLSVDDEITYNEMEDEVIDKCTNTYIVNYLDKIKEYVFKARHLNDVKIIIFFSIAGYRVKISVYSEMQSFEMSGKIIHSKNRNMPFITMFSSGNIHKCRMPRVAVHLVSWDIQMNI